MEEISMNKKVTLILLSSILCTPALNCMETDVQSTAKVVDNSGITSKTVSFVKDGLRHPIANYGKGAAVYGTLATGVVAEEIYSKGAGLKGVYNTVCHPVENKKKAIATLGAAALLGEEKLTGGFLTTQAKKHPYIAATIIGLYPAYRIGKSAYSWLFSTKNEERLAEEARQKAEAEAKPAKETQRVADAKRQTEKARQTRIANLQRQLNATQKEVQKVWGTYKPQALARFRTQTGSGYKELMDKIESLKELMDKIESLKSQIANA